LTEHLINLYTNKNLELVLQSRKARRFVKVTRIAIYRGWSAKTFGRSVGEAQQNNK